MSSSELQNYITQSRQQGMTDDQIRQTLASQGWLQVDLDQAFGVAPSAPVEPVVPTAPIASLTAAPATAATSKLILIIVLILISSAAVIAVIFFVVISKRSNVSSPQTKTDQSSFPGNKISSSGSAIPTSSTCGDWPKSTSAMAYTQSSQVPADYPSDIPMYPNSAVAGYLILNGATAKGVNLAACSGDSIDQVANYFVSNGASWGIKNPYSDLVNNTINNSLGNALGQAVNSKTLSGVQGKNGLVINIQQNGNKTWILSEVIINK